jgi:hypothetical protein
MSQTTDILNLLQSGPLTALDALERIGCFRLASRINDLRKAGHNIQTNTITLPNGKQIAQYTLTKGAINGQ